MGRTNPTYRDALRALEGRWADFRRALRRRDQPRFDRLFAYAREHADAGGLLNHRDPLFPTLLSVDLEQEARLDDHGERLDDHGERLAELEAAVESNGDAVESVGDAGESVVDAGESVVDAGESNGDAGESVGDAGGGGDRRPRPGGDGE